MSRNPYLFVVGCPRSGTTLLQRMLDHHPMLSVMNEARFMLRLAKDGSRENDPPLTRKDIAWVRTYPRFQTFGFSGTTVNEISASAQTYGEFVSSLYSEYARQQGKSLAGEKTPRYLRFLPRIHAVFPWTRIIHLIRDGRDVFLSTRQWTNKDRGPGKIPLWRDEPVAVAALWWQWQVSMGQRDGAQLGSEHYHEVKYEDLVARPEATLRNLTEFLKLPFASEMLAFSNGRVRTDKDLSAKKAWLPATPGLRNWRAQMPATDVELFESLSGELLSNLGYERAFSTASAEVAQVAERCRRWWEKEMSQRPIYRDTASSARVESQTCRAGTI